MSSGLMPASAMLFCWRPVVAPNIFEVPMPVSNSTSLSPMFTIGEFCSSTILSGDRKLSVSIFVISSSGAPTKVDLLQAVAIVVEEFEFAAGIVRLGRIIGGRLRGKCGSRGNVKRFTGWMTFLHSDAPDRKSVVAGK